MTQTKQRNNVGETVNDHGPPTRKKKLSDKIKDPKDKLILHLNLSNLVFRKLKYNIGKFSATFDYMPKESNHCCVAHQFNLSSISYIYKRPEIVYLANNQSRN